MICCAVWGVVELELTMDLPVPFGVGPRGELDA